MSSWLSFILLLLASLAAARTSLRAVKLYFRAQAIATVALFGFSQRYPLDSLAYWLVYLACWILLMECCVFILWDAGVTRAVADKGVILAMSMLIVTLAAMGPMTRDSVLVLGTGFADALIGFCLLSVWPKSDQWHALKWIGILAITNSFLDFGYVINEDWEAANSWLPSFLPTAIFSWIFARQALSKRIEYGAT